MSFVPRLCVLLVDDDPDSQFFYSLVLHRAGYDVLQAHDGLEALMLASASSPDLILMDLVMPVMDGWEVGRRLKANPARRRVPLVGMSAGLLSDDAYHALARTGFDGYVQKPLKPTELLNLVRSRIGDP